MLRKKTDLITIWGSNRRNQQINPVRAASPVPLAPACEAVRVTRYGAQFGPDITFLGVERCDWSDPATYAGADVVILGAPFDGGTSHRAGTRFGPQYIRQTCYLPHDGSRPSLALRVDGLQDLQVYDAGDVEMFSGDAARSVQDLQHAVHQVTANGAIPLVLGGDHTIAWPDAAGGAQHLGQGRISMI